MGRGMQKCQIPKRRSENGRVRADSKDQSAFELLRSLAELKRAKRLEMSFRKRTGGGGFGGIQQRVKKIGGVTGFCMVSGGGRRRGRAEGQGEAVGGVAAGGQLIGRVGWGGLGGRREVLARRMVTVGGIGGGGRAWLVGGVRKDAGGEGRAGSKAVSG